MTYFPLRQTTCFFIPLVAPCKPLLLSLDTPLSQDSDNPGTLLDILPIQGDFTNGTAFRDFICRLPSDLYALSSRLLNRDSLEEARSDLGWDCHRLCNAVAQLRKHMTEYEQI